MVKVREDHPKTADGNVDLESWLAKVSKTTRESPLSMLANACQFIHDIGYRPSPMHTIHSALRTGMEMVDILASLHLDQASLTAALFYRLVREHRLDIEVVREHFGAEITGLIEGVLGMAAINVVQSGQEVSLLGNSNDQQLEKIRKMLVSIIDDVRVALIKIAERTCIIRLAKYEPLEKRQKVAREVFAIYAPLAHRLGIGYVKWELEDLAFSYLNPSAYKRIARLLDERRVDREEYLRSSIHHLNGELQKTSIDAKIEGRVKHIYSIWRKMQRKGLEFHELYDIRAVRILVDKVQNCYAVLGAVHSIWHHVPCEFDDYIANPKVNGYQSLHTAVVGPQGKTLEVQIRTHAMHTEAELGVCAHWAYKGTDVERTPDSYEQKLNWLRQVLEWHEEIGHDVDSFADQWWGDVEPDRIYVFTRDGHVVDLPAGATPIDFAYRVHTEVGNHCRGAKIFGRIVPLTYTLKTGDQVDILTANSAGPSRDWLNTDMGYIKTSRARAKAINWFRKQDRDVNIVAGKQMLESEFKKLALKNIDFHQLAKSVNFICADDLFTACGAGDVRLNYIVHMAQRQLDQLPSSKKQTPVLRFRQQRIDSVHENSVIVEGVGNLLTHIARCCHPVPGDSISGYITLGRGVTIHRKDCSNMLHLENSDLGRVISVHWANKKIYYFPVRIRVEAFDRPNLIRDISMLLSHEKVNVMDMNTHVSSKKMKPSFYFKLKLVAWIACHVCWLSYIVFLTLRQPLGMKKHWVKSEYDETFLSIIKKEICRL